MTEEEAEVMAERLTRIWEIPVQWRRVEAGGEIVIFGQVTNEVVFCYAWHVTSYQCQLWRTHNGYVDGRLFCPLDTGVIGSNHPQIAPRPPEYLLLRCAQFAEEWMDFFRRGCWLSGCPIEATAHEKAEWIRGFTSEEIQAWNLQL